MRYAVLGAGGVGGRVGGALARAGHPVTLLVRPGRQHHYPERLRVESKTLGTFEAPVRVTDTLDDPVDVVWFTVKATALEEALRAVPEQELGNGVVVPLLNGVDHVQLLRERYGPERVLPGTIRVEAEQVELDGMSRRWLTRCSTPEPGAVLPAAPQARPLKVKTRASLYSASGSHPSSAAASSSSSWACSRSK